MESKSCPVCFAEVNAQAIKCPQCGARQPGAPPMHRGHGKVISGVSAMVAFQFGVDPTLIRVLWVAGAVFSAGLAIGVYMLFWVVTPAAPGGQAPLSRWLDVAEHLFGLDRPARSRGGPS